MSYLTHVINLITFMYSRKFNSDWDARLSDILNNYKNVEFDDHTLTFTYGDFRISVWTSNRWYSYGHVYEINNIRVPRGLEYRLRFKTMRRLNDLRQSLIAENLKKVQSPGKREYYALSHSAFAHNNKLE